MITSPLKTHEEIQALKQSWLEDPWWDIEDTEGFEAHREILAEFRQNQEAKWAKARQDHLLMVAERIGHPGDAKAAERYERWKTGAKQSAGQATTLLVHYMSLAVPNFNHEHEQELGEIVELIVDAAACEALARSIWKPRVEKP